MGKSINTTAYLLRFWINFSPVMAFIYLISWGMQFFAKALFEIVDSLIGFFPRYVDTHIYSYNLEWRGVEFSMSYALSATILITTTIIAMWIEPRYYTYTCVRLNKLEKENEYKEEQLRQKFVAKQQKEKLKRIQKQGFCGLFELQIEYLSTFDKTPEDLETLKFEFSKMIYQKLKEKYPKVKFAVSEKLFFYSRDFSICDSFLEDLIKLFKILREIDKQKFIKTEFLLSLANEDEVESTKYLYKLLVKINEMKNFNKVMVFENFSEHYISLEEKKYGLACLGKLKIDIEKNVDYSGEYGCFLGLNQI